MGANDGINGVGIGLGHKPNPSALAFNGTGGTAVVYHDPSDYAGLMVLRGRTWPEWSVVYPPGPPAAVVTFGRDKLKGRAGSTTVTFSGVQVLEVRHVPGAVEVTLQYGAVERMLSGGTSTNAGEVVEYRDGDDAVGTV